MALCYNKLTKEKGEPRILGENNKGQSRQETEWLRTGGTRRKPVRWMKYQGGK